MAWIELHDTVREHKKTWALAGLLGISNAHAVGLLACLWTWALCNATDGDILGFPARAISRAADWEGDPDTFVQALSESGYVTNGCLHDWNDYAGRLIERKEKNAARMRAARAQSVRNTCTAQNTHVQDTFDACAGATIPNHTNIPPISPKGESMRQKKPKGEPPLFAEFYAAYPKKTARPKAAAAFAKLHANEALLAQMLSVLDTQRNSDQWRRENGQFIPHPATWLNERRWEDELPQMGTLPKQDSPYDGREVCF